MKIRMFVPGVDRQEIELGLRDGAPLWGEYPTFADGALEWQLSGVRVELDCGSGGCEVVICLGGYEAYVVVGTLLVYLSRFPGGEGGD